MKKITTPRAGGQADVLRTLAKALAPYLPEPPKQDNAEYYSQHDSPLGRRRHLELVRSKALVGHKVGKRVLVRRDAVHHFIEQHVVTPLFQRRLTGCKSRPRGNTVHYSRGVREQNPTSPIEPRQLRHGGPSHCTEDAAVGLELPRTSAPFSPSS